jgi:hypothetical protein
MEVIVMSQPPQTIDLLTIAKQVYEEGGRA